MLRLTHVRGTLRGAATASTWGPCNEVVQIPSAPVYHTHSFPRCAAIRAFTSGRELASPAWKPRTTDLRIPENLSREMLHHTFLSACERVRGAADLPERLVIEKLRPLWTPVLGDDEFFLDFRELTEGLRQAGVAGRRAIKQISKARSRYPVTEATLTAAATLHTLIPEHSLRAAGYCSIEQVKEHLRFIVKQSNLSDSRLPKLFAALEVWYPAYEWARDECGEDNRSPGWTDPALIASLK